MKYTQWLCLLLIAFVVACTSPKKQIEKAEAAIRQENYVEAAEQIVKIEQSDVDELEQEQKARYNKVISDISHSGDEAAIDVLLEDFETRF